MPKFIVENNSSGTITVTDATASTDAVNVRTLSRAGFETRFDSVMSFNTGTRVFTIAPSGALPNFKFWVNNTRYTVTASQTTTIPTNPGEWFIQYDAAGQLTHSASPWDVSSDQTCPVSLIYWDGGSSGTYADERHSAYRDRYNHRYLHNTRGTAYDNGLAGTFTISSLSVAPGTIWDEDLKFDLTGTYTTCRLWYRLTGSAGMSMSFSGSSTIPYARVGIDLAYDNSGTLTAVTSPNYSVSWIYATDEMTQPIAAVVGQAQYNSLAAARSASQPSFPNRTVREWKLLYSTIYHRTGGSTVFDEASDYRASSNVPGAASVAGSPASSITYVPTSPFIATNVQGALDELATSVNPAVSATAYSASITATLAYNSASANSSSIYTVSSSLVLVSASNVSASATATLAYSRVNTLYADYASGTTPTVTEVAHIGDWNPVSNNLSYIRRGSFIRFLGSTMWQGVGSSPANDAFCYIPVSGIFVVSDNVSITPISCYYISGGVYYTASIRASESNGFTYLKTSTAMPTQSNLTIDFTVMMAYHA